MTSPSWPPAPIDHVDRTDRTRARVQHAKDHDDLEKSVNAIITVLGAQPSGASATVTDEIVRLQGTTGAGAGQPGPAGPAGTTIHRFYGQGPPGVLIGAKPADEYVDTLTGDLYVLS